MKSVEYYRMFGMRGLVFVIKSLLSSTSSIEKFYCPEVSGEVFFRLKTSDVEIYKQVFYDTEYSSVVGENPAVIIDAGANIGYASLYFAHKFPQALIIAIEPEKSNFAMLEKNTANHDNIIAIQAALWSENASVEMKDPGMGEWAFHAQSSDSGNENSLHSIPGMTIDRIMQEHHLSKIDILKMDIEGGEIEVFKSSASWIDKVGMMIVELHERSTPGCNRSFYNATNGFSQEWMQGENVYLCRK